ncbi:hypothetical protein PV350_31280 [Streptomyces sp. PA03-6a]|nr:hypothetical protein [Streptomyces sp. PA03-6a]
MARAPHPAPGTWAAGLRELLAEVDRLTVRVAELQTPCAPRICECGHSHLAHTIPTPHSCFAFGQTCPCQQYRQLPPDEAVAQVRRNLRAAEAGEQR